MPKRIPARVTISTIAERAGVSKVAVSYALNGRPGVSEVTRARILAIADELGWAPDSAARALKRSRNGIVGMVLARPASTLGLEPYFMEFVSGLQQRFVADSIGLLLQVAVDTEAEIATYRRWKATRQVDGVIVTDLRVDDERFEVLTQLGLPAVVATSAPVDRSGVSCVWADDSSSVSDVVRYLHASGHRCLARVAGLRELAHVGVRTAAMRLACAELGIEEPTILNTDFSGDDGARAMRQLLAQRRRPTAVIFDSDLMAVAGFGVASEMGFDVPGDLSIIGWDDSPLCQLTRPALSAMHSDVPGFGRAVAAALLAQLESGQPHVVHFGQSVLVPRASSGALLRRPTDR